MGRIIIGMTDTPIYDQLVAEWKFTPVPIAPPIVMTAPKPGARPVRRKRKKATAR